MNWDHRLRTHWSLFVPLIGRLVPSYSGSGWNPQLPPPLIASRPDCIHPGVKYLYRQADARHSWSGGYPGHTAFLDNLRHAGALFLDVVVAECGRGKMVRHAMHLTATRDFSRALWGLPIVC